MQSTMALHQRSPGILVAGLSRVLRHLITYLPGVARDAAYYVLKLSYLHFSRLCLWAQIWQLLRAGWLGGMHERAPPYTARLRMPWVSTSGTLNSVTAGAARVFRDSSQQRRMFTAQWP